MGLRRAAPSVTWWSRPRDVVQGGRARAAVVDLVAVGRDPLADRAAPAARTARTAAGTTGPTEAAVADEDVAHLAVGDQLLELGERRRRIAAVEAADGDHRLAGGDDDRCRGL